MLIAALLTALLAAQAAPPDLPVALVIEYADGRRISTVLGARPHRSWTPMFPRIAGWRPPDGGEHAAAIDYVATRDGDAVRVKVSLRFGRPHRRQTDVAEVLVVQGRTLAVEELRQFGVEPVLLSLAPVGPLAMFPPRVETPTGGLEVTVDLLNDVPPRYRTTVRNRTATGVAGFRVQSSRAGRPAVSTVQLDPFGDAIVAPGGTYTFDLANSGTRLDGPAAVSPDPFDTIALTAVLWEDGTWEGDERDARQQLEMEAGRQGTARQHREARRRGACGRTASAPRRVVRVARRAGAVTVWADGPGGARRCGAAGAGCGGAGRELLAPRRRDARALCSGSRAVLNARRYFPPVTSMNVPVV